MIISETACLNILQVTILLLLYPDDKQTLRKVDSVLRRNLELLLQVVEPQTVKVKVFTCFVSQLELSHCCSYFKDKLNPIRKKEGNWM